MAFLSCLFVCLFIFPLSSNFRERGPGKVSSDFCILELLLPEEIHLVVKVLQWYVLMCLVISSTWNVDQGRVLDPISSPKCGLWDSFPSLFSHSQVLLTIILLEVSKLIFRLEESCPSYPLNFRDAYDDRTGHESQQPVTLATGSHWPRYLIYYSKMAMYCSCLVCCPTCHAALAFIAFTALFLCPGVFQ